VSFGLRFGIKMKNTLKGVMVALTHGLLFLNLKVRLEEMG
jgi:hypothetical protein